MIREAYCRPNGDPFSINNEKPAEGMVRAMSVSSRSSESTLSTTPLLFSTPQRQDRTGSFVHTVIGIMYG